ncbi:MULTISPECIES: hypothetical protein [unclassified Lysobacter]|uniref:hypothetical protein n=1 Tax=unclassified Lysobacter TaxID=2635362 RepID=UPI001BE826A6|nr:MULTISPECIES: hypothetical protein [unclassified Lysobacter]MBT2748999.1 hypothetical protein [Lysobacter sp. ISL-42]MBT2750332.1 hypothetical protein [Lysobacter sp. ISL-50]MBT2778430.1 hypothetical protein [Lysobacter sp. ISL-54]MBT2781046.1 hypothetical protein [Lysobacter sp. ISL-52]
MRFDTETDATSSIELAAEFFEASKSDDRYWKWYVIALHSGMQGLFCMALDNGNELLVQKSSTAQKMISALDSGTPYPPPYMDNFVNLYTKLLSVRNLRAGAKALPSEGDHKAAIESFDQTRNDLVHFNTKSWSVSRNHRLKEALIFCGISAYVRNESGSILWHDEHLQDRTNAAWNLLEIRLKNALRELSH